MDPRVLCGLTMICALLLHSGCSNSTPPPEVSKTPGPGNGKPTFVLAWSEHPSWSLFGVAEDQKLIDGREGSLGAMESRWDVDIVLIHEEFTRCIELYRNFQADAACLNNFDALVVSDSRATICVMPTSTSSGAEACIAVGVDSIDAMAGTTTYGPTNSVSHYCFERVLKQQGKKLADFPFQNMESTAAANALASQQAGIGAIMVRDALVPQTLRARQDAKVLFDSSNIAEEIVGLVVVGKDTLSKPGGEPFANALLDTFYSVNKMLNNAETKDQIVTALAARFGQATGEEMSGLLTQTKMLNTPSQGLELLKSDKFQFVTLPAMAGFLMAHDVVKPSFGLNSYDAQLNFDTQFLSGMSGSSQYGPDQ